MHGVLKVSYLHNYVLYFSFHPLLYFSSDYETIYLAFMIG